jgi:hypothetical protein
MSENVKFYNDQQHFEHPGCAKVRLKPQEKETVFFQFLSYAQKLKKHPPFPLFLRPLDRWELFNKSLAITENVKLRRKCNCIFHLAWGY